MDKERGMTDAQEILKLIESVDPSDTSVMDEIDARVWCWLDRTPFIRMYEPRSYPYLPEFIKESCGSEYGEALYHDMKYTRNRDALKRIRPGGWKVGIYFGDSIWEANIAGNGVGVSFDSRQLPTEELAELHVIIQAIQYEREKSK